jgi:hypothetical protein
VKIDKNKLLVEIEKEYEASVEELAADLPESSPRYPNIKFFSVYIFP